MGKAFIYIHLLVFNPWKELYILELVGEVGEVTEMED